MKVKLAIDFGSANMKMAGLINDVIQKKIIKSFATTTQVQEKNLVEYEDRKVYFGVGYPLVKKNKTERNFIIESILFATNAIYGELDNNFEIQLAIGLPLDQFTSESKNEYLEDLQKNYLNKTITGKVNKKDITIKITYINIYAEGFSGFMALIDNIDTKKPVLIVDVGYKTTDVVGIKNDIFENELSVDNYGSITKGMAEILQDITNQFNNTTKANYNIETIEDAIINNTQIRINTDKGMESKNINQWLKYGNEVLSYIFNEIEIKYFPDWRNRNLYLIGGGVEVINYIFNEMNNTDKSKSIETERFTNNKENNILMFANVKGYLLQLLKDTVDIVESEDILIPESKLDKNKKSVALTNE